MAVSQVVRNLAFTPTGATFGGTLTIPAPASATAMTTAIQLTSSSPEFAITGVTFGGTNAASTVTYNCAGPNTSITYNARFSVTDVATS
jgi:hypothetical protein